MRLFAGLLLLAACGTSDPVAPVVSELSITTMPVVRGMDVAGKVKVTDDNGLDGLKLKLALSGADTASIQVPVTGATADLSAIDATFSFTLQATAATGHYDLAVSAIDGGGLESDAATTSFDVAD